MWQILLGMYWTIILPFSSRSRTPIFLRVTHVSLNHGNSIFLSVTGLQWACDHFQANKGDSMAGVRAVWERFFSFRKMVAAVPFLRSCLYNLPFLLVQPFLPAWPLRMWCLELWQPHCNLEVRSPEIKPNMNMILESRHKKSLGPQWCDCTAELSPRLLSFEPHVKDVINNSTL